MTVIPLAGTDHWEVVFPAANVTFGGSQLFWLEPENSSLVNFIDAASLPIVFSFTVTFLPRVLAGPQMALLLTMSAPSTPTEGLFPSLSTIAAMSPVLLIQAPLLLCS